MIAMMRTEIVPRLLEQVPHQPSPEELAADRYRHRLVMIFDREGYSPAWIKELLQQRIACHTYRKYPGQDWAESEFSQQTVRGPRGEQWQMKLAERGSWLGETVWVREIRKLTETGHQTAVISTDFQSGASQIAVQMFSRWSQENYFKYMIEHYNLDRLVEYETEPLAETTRVVNPYLLNNPGRGYEESQDAPRLSACAFSLINSARDGTRLAPLTRSCTYW
jgi:hypothetical protein